MSSEYYKPKDSPRMLNGCSKSVSLVEEFEERGWDAWTCDLQPSEGWHKHIQGNVLNHLNDGWDLFIVHPDCTYTANSGVRWRIERNEFDLIKEAAEFFNECLDADIPMICAENPIHHKYAREFIRKYDQIIQPWNFGEMESKAICLWLKGLPLLETEITIKPAGVKQSVWREPPNKDRKANRSRNFREVSRTWAEQWGNL